MLRKLQFDVCTSLAAQAKLRFQEIQEAYSVLSDDTKRVMNVACVYDSVDDVDGFSDFLDEMVEMMNENTMAGVQNSQARPRPLKY